MIWKDRYKLGVTLIDEQHQELFTRVSDFVEVLRSSVPWEQRVEKVNETLNFMKDYVVTHFHDEEKYQKQIGYPEFAAHKKIHNDMVKYVAEVASQYERDGYNEQLMQQFAGKLLAWLINHVASEDQKVADFVRKGVVEDE
ncbi:MAG: hemerythrin family protein [Syntrophomonadaceae bacterium]|nr:hemerythrin family protein [Syntrophomonadaceae bacterium]